MNTQQIKALQDGLVKQGYMTQAQVDTGYGIYGPKTTAAYAAYQNDLNTAAKANPAVNSATGGQSYTDFMAANGGDISGAVNPTTGQPFTSEQQQAALSQATSDLAPAFQAQETNDIASAQSTMAQKQAAYQNYLATQGTQFQADKTNQDQTAANNGVLFSGGRAQKLQTLQNTYNQNAAYRGSLAAADIGNTARDLQYKYGNDAANSLSQYYNQLGQSYNANVATGGVNSNGLSSIYNPSQYNFQGTEVNANKAAAQQRAAGLLWNSSNKLVQGGYNNKY